MGIIRNLSLRAHAGMVTARGVDGSERGRGAAVGAAVAASLLAQNVLSFQLAREFLTQMN
eukprot:6201872-Pleurochrysis_carterae.AAC.1